MVPFPSRPGPARVSQFRQAHTFRPLLASHTTNHSHWSPAARFFHYYYHHHHHSLTLLNTLNILSSPHWKHTHAHTHTVRSTAANDPRGGVLAMAQPIYDDLGPFEEYLRSMSCISGPFVPLVVRLSLLYAHQCLATWR